MRKLVQLLPLQFRVLYRQFLLRIFDFESLSVHADIPRFLGQFASVLAFCSLVGAAGMLMSGDRWNAGADVRLEFAWRMDQSLISGMMVVVGLIAIVTWDSIFPDRSDVMVLAPLPIKPRPILLAKIAASASLVGLAVLVLNFATGLIWPLLLGSQHQSVWGFLQAFAAYWFTMSAASAFLFCSVLSAQGLMALFLPRRLFLGFSAILQVVAFGVVLAGYFLQPSLTTPAALSMPENRWALAWSPAFWFFGFFNQLNGTLPKSLRWLAWRGWIGLAIALLGAIISLTLSYFGAMRKTVEEPELVPGARRLHCALRFGSSLQTAILLFCFRSILRSRHHRLAFSFYLAIICSIALSWLHVELSSPARIPLNADFLVATFAMMSFAVFGLRNTFARPISLNANWVWRITQLAPAATYIAAAKGALLFIAVVPVWIISALLSTRLVPRSSVMVHLGVLALVGWILAEVAVIGLTKVPFTCSYLPGKVHVQVMLWSCLVLIVVSALSAAELELPALGSPLRCAFMLSALAIAGCSLYRFNRQRSKTAVIHFEDFLPEIITTLGLASPSLTSSSTSVRS